MLVYPDLDSFKEMYCMYAKIHLQPKYNEILLIVTNYETPQKVKQNIKDLTSTQKGMKRKARL